MRGMKTFNSATAVKPWRQFVSPWTTTATDTFNSATAVKPWRLQADLAFDRGHIHLQFGHGGEAVETAWSTVDWLPDDTFNSATAVKPWRPPTRSRGSF